MSLAVGGRGQTPDEQPAEGMEEDLTLIRAERPPDWVARVWAGVYHPARGGLLRFGGNACFVS